jgi:lipopolysaccharide transport system permease protein
VATTIPERDTVLLRPRKGWGAIDVRELWRFRDLLTALAVRDVKLRYRQTALGVVWVILQPLLAAGVFSFVFGKVANLPTPNNVPYIVFAFAGLLGWNIFQSTVSKSSTSLVQNAGMLSKIYFPRLALPLSTVAGTMLDFVVAFCAMLVLGVVSGYVPGVQVLTLPLWIVLVLMISLGLGVASAALMVTYRDVAQAIPVGLQLLLYISPVAYSIEAVPKNLRTVYALNPMVGILEGFRWALVPGSDLNVSYVVYAAVVSVVLFVVGGMVFARMERRFADVI